MENCIAKGKNVEQITTKIKVLGMSKPNSKLTGERTIVAARISAEHWKAYSVLYLRGYLDKVEKQDPGRRCVVICTTNEEGRIINSHNNRYL